ncbi:RDD family protein [Microlunatus antarcticus]|uniref:Putative RDD family membrane protein YckC n=1 Tax=Microlunatus antarcticus TaxID=53388 RepID=A0A7W5P5V1_9ACTN|nr:RDD family protein [Microlunatus antarcticus]MBB3325865.1 putative RDD family membrane protein YckC [Microlunatus antarcticus]
MSDIPVGSPPAPPGRHAAPGGWYPDPLDLARERYWDGWQWSRNTRDSEVPPAYRQAPGAPAAPPGPYGGQTTPYGSQPDPYGSQPTPYGSQPTPYGGQPAYYGGAQQPASRQAARTADGVPLAGWWWRALAGLIDAALVGTVSGLLTLPFYRDLLGAVRTFWNAALAAAQAGAPPPATPNFAAMMTGTDQLLVTAVTFAIGMAYHLPFLRTRGATLGLLACGLKVVPVDEGRSTARLGWSTVVVRALLWVLPGALSLRILTVADVLLPLWHPKRQTLHDLAARTQVIRTRQGG